MERVSIFVRISLISAGKSVVGMRCGVSGARQVSETKRHHQHYWAKLTAIDPFPWDPPRKSATRELGVRGDDFDVERGLVERPMDELVGDGLAHHCPQIGLHLLRRQPRVVDHQ